MLRHMRHKPSLFDILRTYCQLRLPSQVYRRSSSGFGIIVDLGALSKALFSKVDAANDLLDRRGKGGHGAFAFVVFRATSNSGKRDGSIVENDSDVLVRFPALCLFHVDVVSLGGTGQNLELHVRCERRDSVCIGRHISTASLLCECQRN